MDDVTVSSATSRTIFLDVDGTILGPGARIAPSTVSAVRAARKAGHLVYLCTGRSVGDVRASVVEIGFDGAITSGGAYVTQGDELVFAQAIPRAEADALIDYFAQQEIAYLLQSFVQVYASDRMLPYIEDVHRDHLDAGDDPFIRLTPMDQIDLDTVTKAVFVSNDLDTVDRVRTDLGDRFHVIPGSMPMPGGTNGEVSAIGVNKGTGIRHLLETLGRPASEAIGIGDSWNDAEMFDLVGTSVAMGNAPRELQMRADRVTTSVLDDGVQNAFVALGLI